MNTSSASLFHCRTCDDEPFLRVLRLESSLVYCQGSYGLAPSRPLKYGESLGACQKNAEACNYKELSSDDYNMPNSETSKSPESTVRIMANAYNRSGQS